MSAEFALLEAACTYLKREFGVCNGVYLNGSNAITCGVGHNAEAQPVAKGHFFRWLKDGMTTEEVDTLLVRDLLCVKKIVDNEHAEALWFAEFSKTQKAGWYVLAFLVGSHLRSKMQAVYPLLETGSRRQDIYVAIVQTGWAYKNPKQAARIADMVAFDNVPDYYSHDPEIIQPSLIS